MMTEIQNKVYQALWLSVQNCALKKCVFSKSQENTIKKKTLELITLNGKITVQETTYQTDNKAIVKNISITDIDRIKEACIGFSQINLITALGEAEYKSSKSGKEIFIGGNELTQKLQSKQATLPLNTIRENNREKNRILDGNEPFLKALGISDKEGRIHDKMQAKYRQINRFLEMVRDVLPSLPTEGRLNIYDLCCGKSYLSFAIYHYFAYVLKRKVNMVGMDLKPDVIEYCNDVAKSIHYDGMQFICGDICKLKVNEHVHLVVSLHACDFATDFVLRKAVDWNADVILSTPCCHHEMNHTLQRDAIAFIYDYSMLRQKFCDAATDALRLKYLEASGYKTAALELIDPEDTPKNILLRGIRKLHFDTQSEEAKKAMQEYLKIKAFLVGDAEVHF